MPEIRLSAAEGKQYFEDLISRIVGELREKERLEAHGTEGTGTQAAHHSPQNQEDSDSDVEQP